MSTERGVIQNKARAKQLNSFKDLIRMRNITPTDIDGLIDYNGKAFIYLEGKMKEKRIEDGQKRALENVVLSHWKASHPAMVLLFWHDTPLDSEIPVAWMFVKMIFTVKPIPCLTRDKWKDTYWYFPQSETIKVKDAIGFFEETFKNYGL